jgi:glutamate-1-semialdehyde 2,1-aminomutase
MLAKLRATPPYAYLEEQVADLAESFRQSAADANVPVTINQIGSMITVFFTDRPVTDYTSAKTANAEKYGRWFWALMERGVYLPPSQFESAFVSAAFSPDDFATAKEAARQAFACLKS